jgi:hypothetical protein
MSVRVQVIVDEEEAARFRAEAARETKSLSAWLRDAGRKMLERNGQDRALTDPGALKKFFQECSAREKGKEPDWDVHKKLIEEGSQGGGNRDFR